MSADTRGVNEWMSYSGTKAFWEDLEEKLWKDKVSSANFL